MKVADDAEMNVNDGMTGAPERDQHQEKSLTETFYVLTQQAISS